GGAMSTYMNSNANPPTTPVGRILHDLAAHDVPDDRDLRGQVMQAIEQRTAERAQGTVTDRDWTRPAREPRRPTAAARGEPEEHIMSDITQAQPEPISLPQRRWFREG